MGKKQVRLSLLSAAVIGLLSLTACSQEETIPQANPSNAIRFVPLAGKTQSRASVTTNSTINDFRVMGNSVNDDYPDNLIFDKVLVSKIDGEWTYSPLQLWPADGSAMNFWAYSPGLSKNISEISETGGEPTFHYTVPQDVNGAQQVQEDFLLARSTDAANGIQVTLQFQHALSRVVFRARSGIKGMNYLVTDLELCNLRSSGELNMDDSNNNGDEFPTVNAGFSYENDGSYDNIGSYTTFWDTSGSDKEDYKVTLPANNAPVYVGYYQDGTFTNLHSDVNALMVMPQETELGAGSTTVDPTADGALYLKITFKAAGSSGAPITAWMPVCIPGTNNEPLAFEIGRQYTFDIIIGNGLPGAQGITFKVGVTDWKDAPANVPIPPQMKIGDYYNVNGVEGIVNAIDDPDNDDIGSPTQLLVLKKMPTITNWGSLTAAQKTEINGLSDGLLIYEIPGYLNATQTAKDWLAGTEARTFSLAEKIAWSLPEAEFPGLTTAQKNVYLDKWIIGMHSIIEVNAYQYASEMFDTAQSTVITSSASPFAATSPGYTWGTWGGDNLDSRTDSKMCSMFASGDKPSYYAVLVDL